MKVSLQKACGELASLLKAYRSKGKSMRCGARLVVAKKRHPHVWRALLHSDPEHLLKVIWQLDRGTRSENTLDPKDGSKGRYPQRVHRLLCRTPWTNQVSSCPSPGELRVVALGSGSPRSNLANTQNTSSTRAARTQHARGTHTHTQHTGSTHTHTHRQDTYTRTHWRCRLIKCLE